jgi:hypothetical protein
MIGRTFPGQAASPVPAAAIEGKEALELYLLRISRNTEVLREQLTLLRTALAERSSLLATIDGPAPPE